MARHTRLQVLNQMLDTGLVPVFYTPDPQAAAGIVQAGLEAGVRCFEFTNRGDAAHLVFQGLVSRFADEPRVILGAGSLLDAPTAALYLQLGAEFIVGPALNPDVARLCNRRKVAYMPGCGSVSEISQAEELGAEICKVFPAGQVGGPAFIRAVLGPMPWSRLMPTGGVNASQASIREWIQAGAACLGMGSSLITPEILQTADYPALSRTMRDVLAWIHSARQG